MGDEDAGDAETLERGDDERTAVRIEVVGRLVEEEPVAPVRARRQSASGGARPGASVAQRSSSGRWRPQLSSEAAGGPILAGGKRADVCPGASTSWRQRTTVAPSGSTRIRPCCGASSPATRRRRVLFPAPFSPTSPVQPSGKTALAESSSGKASWWANVTRSSRCWAQRTPGTEGTGPPRARWALIGASASGSGVRGHGAPPGRRGGWIPAPIRPSNLESRRGAKRRKPLRFTPGDAIPGDVLDRMQDCRCPAGPRPKNAYRAQSSASASISTSAFSETSAASTSVFAGWTCPNLSPCALATASQSWILRTNTRVRTTSSRRPPSDSSAPSILSMTKCVCAAASVPPMDRLAVGRGGPGHRDPRTLPDRARVAGDRLPGGSAEAQRPIAGGPGLIRGREALDVMTEVAGGGEVRRPAVLVAAVAADGGERRRCLREARAVLVVENQREDPRVVLEVRPLPEPCADDDRSHRRLVEDGTAGDVRHGDPMLPRDGSDGPGEELERVPSRRRLDEAVVLHLRPGGELGLRRRGPVQPPLGEESPGERPVGQQLDSVLGAESRHPPRCASIEEREDGLVRDEANPAGDRDPEMRGVEVHDAEVTDEPLGPELLEEEERIEPDGSENRQAWN